MRRLFNLVFFTLFASPAWAAAPAFCAPLAFLADSDVAPEELIETTYRQFLDTLGTTAAPETWAAFEDPFTVPRQKRDLGALQKNLREFETLLKSRGWDTPAVRARLMAVASERSATQTVAKQKVQRAIDRIETDYPIQTERAPQFEFSPDGRYLLEFEHVGAIDNRTHMVVKGHDLQTRKPLAGYEVPVKKHFVTSPDGHHILYPGERGTIVRTPVVDGKIDVKGSQVLGLPDRNIADVSEVHPHPNGNLVFARHFFNSRGMKVVDPPVGGFFLYDTQNNTRVPIGFGTEPVNHNGQARTWGVTPDGKLWTYDRTTRLSTYSVAPDGKATRENNWTPKGQIQFDSFSGKAVLAHKDAKLMLQPGPDPMPMQEVRMPAGSDGQPLYAEYASFQPGEPRFAVLANDLATGRSRFLWFDEKTGERIGERPLPAHKFDWIVFELNGSKVVVGDDHGRLIVGSADLPGL